MTLPPTFMAKTRPATECIVWTAAANSKGYGCFAINGVSQLAHRVAWEDRYGPIPAGLTVDHLCRVRSCVNTDHMELVTPGENMRRAKRINVGDSCGNGHIIASVADLYLHPRGSRECRECRRATYRRAKARPSSSTAGALSPSADAGRGSYPEEGVTG